MMIRKDDGFVWIVRYGDTTFLSHIFCIGYYLFGKGYINTIDVEVCV